MGSLLLLIINVMAMQGKVWSQLTFGGISFCWKKSQILPLNPFGTTEEKSVLLGRKGGGHYVHWRCVMEAGLREGEEQQNKQADNPESNWTFLKGEILKLFSRNNWRQTPLLPGLFHPTAFSF